MKVMHCYWSPAGLEGSTTLSGWVLQKALVSTHNVSPLYCSYFLEAAIDTCQKVVSHCISALFRGGPKPTVGNEITSREENMESQVGLICLFSLLNPIGCLWWLPGYFFDCTPIFIWKWINIPWNAETFLLKFSSQKACGQKLLNTLEILLLFCK